MADSSNLQKSLITTHTPLLLPPPASPRATGACVAQRPQCPSTPAFATITYLQHRFIPSEGIRAERQAVVAARRCHLFIKIYVTSLKHQKKQQQGVKTRKTWTKRKEGERDAYVNHILQPLEYNSFQDLGPLSHGAAVIPNSNPG